MIAFIICFIAGAVLSHLYADKIKAFLNIKYLAVKEKIKGWL